MTDIASDNRAAMRAPDLSTARLRRRYAADFRFRLYGVLAILAAMGMLGLLLFSIVSKGYPAFFQHEFVMEVNLPREEIDPDNTGDPAVIGDASYRSILRDSIYGLIPVEGREQRRTLAGLWSGAAELQLRDEVLANPELIGGTHVFSFLTSDEADTFYKGQVTDIVTSMPGGEATPTGLEGEITIVTTANGFSQILTEVKQTLTVLADGLSSEIARNELGLGAARQRLAEAESALAEDPANESLQEDARALEASVASGQNSLDKLRAEAADLYQRASSPGGAEPLEPFLPSYFIRLNGGLVKLTEVSNSEATGQAIVPLQSDAGAAAGDWELIQLVTPEDARRLKDLEIAYLLELDRQGLVEYGLSATFFSKGDSREPEQAGVWGAVLGSFFTLVVTLALAFPIGVMTAAYLEEFAPKNRITDLIEVNINNLAAVPSIVFGLLGLAVFLNFFGLPRSAPLVGGMVLALMTLPTIIIAARAALKAVPPSIREAAYGIGASKLQVLTHHTLPLAMPGILTGTIIGMAQALGETAPLLMIGMVAFIVDLPGGFTDPSTVLPVQIYIWADSPERAFEAKTSAAIMVLLTFLILMNALAVLLRKRFERRW